MDNESGQPDCALQLCTAEGRSAFMRGRRGRVGNDITHC